MRTATGRLRPMFEAWAIRHKPSGGYLPAVKPHGKPSYDEPGFGLPRLFTSRRSAQAALNRWLDGRWSIEGGWYGEFGHEYESELVCSPVDGRNAADMEVVRMMVMEFGERTP